MDHLIRKFHNAVRENDETLVEQLLDNGIDPDEPDWDHHGRPAIIDAAYLGHTDMVRLLLETGADPNHRNAQGETALHVSVHPRTFSKGVVQLLLDAGANPDAQEKFQGFSPLHIVAKLCVSNGSKVVRDELLDVLRLLCEHGDVNLRSKRNETPLHRMVIGNMDSTEPLEVLIDSGVDLDVQNDRGETALMCAIDMSHVKMAEMLIKKGSCVSLKDRHFQTPLHYSARKDLLRLVILLLNAQCDINAADLNGDRALHIAASKGLLEMVKVLVTHSGVDINAPNLRGLTPLHTAVESGFSSVVELLLTANCDPSCESKCFLTPLDVAGDEFVRRWHPEIFTMIRNALDQRKQNWDVGETSL